MGLFEPGLGPDALLLCVLGQVQGSDGRVPGVSEGRSPGRQGPSGALPARGQSLQARDEVSPPAGEAVGRLPFPHPGIQVLELGHDGLDPGGVTGEGGAQLADGIVIPGNGIGIGQGQPSHGRPPGCWPVDRVCAAAEAADEMVFGLPVGARRAGYEARDRLELGAELLPGIGPVRRHTIHSPPDPLRTETGGLVARQPGADRLDLPLQAAQLPRQGVELVGVGHDP